MVKVKICGITNLEDALCACDLGADALGFIFYKKSPRYICPEEAQEIVLQLPKSTNKVGVFVNASEKQINSVAAKLQLNMLQFHGSESGEFCSRFSAFKIIKAVRVKDKINLKSLYKYDVWAYLFDTCYRGRFGGTGRAFDWR